MIHDSVKPHLVERHGIGISPVFSDEALSKSVNTSLFATSTLEFELFVSKSADGEASPSPS